MWNVYIIYMIIYYLDVWYTYYFISYLSYIISVYYHYLSSNLNETISHHEGVLIHRSFFGKEATVPPRAEVLWLSEVCTTWYQKALGATKSDKSCRLPFLWLEPTTSGRPKKNTVLFRYFVQLKIAKNQKEWELFWVSSIHEILMLRLLGLRFLCLWTMLKLQHSPKAQLRLLS